MGVVMGLRAFAERELDLIGMVENSGDEMNDRMRKHILTMVDTFADEGHSGFSANYALSLLKSLLAYEPLSPLTGLDDEWTDVSEMSGKDGPTYQNRRCSHVFKDGDGNAYDIDGKVFVDEDGTYYTNFESRVPVVFPYTPKTEYVNTTR